MSLLFLSFLECLAKAGAQMCLQFGKSMEEDAFISPGLCNVNEVLLNLYLGITWGVLLTDAQTLLAEVLM